MQKELTVRGPLLDEKGHVVEAGFARSLVKEYSRKAIKARKTRIKEWDYYLIYDDKYSIGKTALAYISSQGLNGSYTLKEGQIDVFRIPSTTREILRVGLGYLGDITDLPPYNYVIKEVIFGDVGKPSELDFNKIPKDGNILAQNGLPYYNALPEGCESTANAIGKITFYRDINSAMTADEIIAAFNSSKILGGTVCNNIEIIDTEKGE